MSILDSAEPAAWLRYLICECTHSCSNNYSARLVCKLLNMEAYYSKEIDCLQHCVDDGLLTAIAGAQPSGIGKKLTQNGFKMTRSLEDEKLDNNDLAKIIVDSVLMHIKTSPMDIKKFINILKTSGYSRCEKFAAQMSNSSKIPRHSL